ncbi:MAG: hypothetical protein Kow0089_04230 [Desulfobulbaceae bacterium]
MKIAVVYNRESRKVINLFGIPNREKYGVKAIRRITDALKKGGHQVIALEGDKDLIDNLEDFMPRVLKGERPGLVFNLSYGIQGQARYTHVPSILEMVGIPYVGSGPLAHSLALDKVVAKMIFKQNNLPTPDFAVLKNRDFHLPDLPFPLIVKPKNEAVSFGLTIVNDEKELREASDIIFDKFDQDVLAERYIDGREINVGILGNSPPEAFLPAELLFGPGGPAIYTYQDKTHKSGREVRVECPARIDEQLSTRARELAIQAFNALGCFDCARVDMRLDSDNNIYLLEINSLPSLGEHGSYVAAAEAMGMDFTALVNRLVEVASARYFGTPSPPQATGKKLPPSSRVFSYLTAHRDEMDVRLKHWCELSSRSDDLVGKQLLVKEIDKRLRSILMRPVADLSDGRNVWTWETKAGLTGGTLIIIQGDVPFEQGTQYQRFRKDPEWAYGEGVGCVAAPLACLEFSLLALRSIRQLRFLPVGVLCYGDEGMDCRYSTPVIRKAMDAAAEVIVLRPANSNGAAVTERRGQRKYFLMIEGRPIRLGKASRTPEVLRLALQKVEEISRLSSRKKRIAVSAVDIHTRAYPMLLPHQVVITLLTSFPTRKAGDELEETIRQILGSVKWKWDLETVSDRPPMRTRRKNNPLLDSLERIAHEWDIPFAMESSVWPSPGGLVKPGTPVICGMGPIARDIYTSRETVQRISIIQRSLLLSQYLLSRLEVIKPHGKKESRV